MPPIARFDFIARHLGVAKRCVRIVSGGTSRRKVLEIDDVRAEVIAATLNREFDSKLADRLSHHVSRPGRRCRIGGTTIRLQARA
jgi:hypothetical protein